MERPDELIPDEEVKQLKAEISENQADLQNTVAEIQDRLSPSYLKDQAATTVRDATIGRMQHMMNSTNPVPYALIGIGAAWLLASQRSSGQWRANGGNWGGNRDYGSTNYSGTYMSSDDQYKSAYASRTGSNTAEWQSAASDRAAVVSDSARRVANQARYRWGSMINNNPMALGMAALAVGALVGSVLPATETENEYLGEARDSAVESAKSLVNETVQKASGTDEVT